MAESSRTIEKIQVYKESFTKLEESLNLKEVSLEEILSKKEYDSVIPDVLKDSSIDEKITYLLINLSSDVKAQFKADIENLNSIETDKDEILGQYNFLADKSEENFNNLANDLEEGYAKLYEEREKNNKELEEIKNDPEFLEMEQLEKRLEDIEKAIKEYTEELENIELDLNNPNIHSKKSLEVTKQTYERLINELTQEKDDINKKLPNLQKKFIIIKKIKEKNNALSKTESTLDKARELAEKERLSYNEYALRCSSIFKENGIDCQDKIIGNIFDKKSYEEKQRSSIADEPVTTEEFVPEEVPVVEEEIAVDEPVTTEEVVPEEVPVVEEEIKNPKAAVQGNNGTIQYIQVPQEPIIEEKPAEPVKKDNKLIEQESLTKPNFNLIKGYINKAEPLSDNDRYEVVSNELLGSNYSRIMDAYQNIDKSDINKSDKKLLKGNIEKDFKLINKDIEQFSDIENDRLYDICGVDSNIKTSVLKNYLNGDFVDIKLKDLNSVNEMIEKYYKIKSEGNISVDDDKFVEKYLINPSKMSFIKQEAEDIYDSKISLAFKRGMFGTDGFTGEYGKKKAVISKMMDITIENSKNIKEKDDIINTADEPIVSQKPFVDVDYKIVEEHKDILFDKPIVKKQSTIADLNDPFKELLKSETYPPVDIKSVDEIKKETQKKSDKTI